jgi:hypothetical protein
MGVCVLKGSSSVSCVSLVYLVSLCLSFLLCLDLSEVE